MQSPTGRGVGGSDPRMRRPGILKSRREFLGVVGAGTAMLGGGAFAGLSIPRLLAQQEQRAPRGRDQVLAFLAADNQRNLRHGLTVGLRGEHLRASAMHARVLAAHAPSLNLDNQFKQAVAMRLTSDGRESLYRLDAGAHARAMVQKHAGKTEADRLAAAGQFTASPSIAQWDRVVDKSLAGGVTPWLLRSASALERTASRLDATQAAGSGPRVIRARFQADCLDDPFADEDGCSGGDFQPEDPGSGGSDGAGGGESAYCKNVHKWILAMEGLMALYCCPCVDLIPGLGEVALIMCASATVQFLWWVGTALLWC